MPGGLKVSRPLICQHGTIHQHKQQQQQNGVKIYYLHHGI